MAIAFGPVLRRRTFLRLVGAGGVAVAVPWLPACSDRSATATAGTARFFTAEERATIEALAGAIVPEDQTVGAVGANAVEYIDRALAAFDNPEPDVYRAGPFSGRWPFQDFESGEPSDRFPPDRFLDVLPLTRLQELSFRIELYGSAAVPNGDANAPIVASTPGLRALYRDAIGQLDGIARDQGAADFASLSDAQKLAAFNRTPAAFRDAFLANVAEGMFSAPEYGGNRDGIAWRDYFYDGDSQPLGHSIYDEPAESFVDRADQPNQTLDPNRPNGGFEPDVLAFVEQVVVGQGGKRFF
ncbi:MAG TPA: gluconate 2-dehydrogenase subunit 3 family protein [Candidatus Binatia bacterium]|nr:gluconate 2-dehydrogenase subunit 3 family protein [Candidatus Binatia bacterium]